jgi:hypothetical protein
MMNMILIGSLVVFILLLAGIFWHKRHRPKQLDVAYFQKKWQEAQTHCHKQDTWPLAVINADKLVDEALKRNKFKGKTMGERLVSAQHEITDNDTIWFAHKLRNKLVHEDLKKLKKKDVMDALIGFRSALKDLGALK